MMREQKTKKSPGKKPVTCALRTAIHQRGRTAYGTAGQADVSVEAVLRFMKDERGLTLGVVDNIANSLDLTLCNDQPPEAND